VESYMADGVRTAIVTGGNRGIGFEACRQLARSGLRVVLTARAAELGTAAARQLVDEGLDVQFTPMDVGDERSVAACARKLGEARIHVDVLVNNAGISPEGALLSLATEKLVDAFRVNFLGAFWTCRAFVPAMIEAGYGRVVNVSSGYGSFAEGLEGPPAYSLSKAALNAFTCKLASEVPGHVKVNAMCPGWVRTRMGGPDAPRSVEQAADTLVWLATLANDGPTGGFFRDRRAISW
jgi:NAD(P)-dependent dehydrogenase (short-subunit alcohol dehydrogenase family)